MSDRPTPTYSIDLVRRKRSLRLFSALLVGAALLSVFHFPFELGGQAFADVIGLFGLGVLGWHKKIQIDKSRRTCLVQSGWLKIPFKVEKYELNKVKQVILKERYEKGSGETGSTTYHVTLAGIRPSRILKSSNPWFARKVAESLAIAINVPFNNQAYKTPSVRQPGELTLSLGERWTMHRVAHPLPVLPADTRLTIQKRGNVLKIYIPAETLNIKLVLILLFGIAVLAVALYPLSSESPIAYFGAFTLFFIATGAGLLAFSGKSLLTMDAKQISFRQGLWPFKGKILIREIKELIIVNDGINLVGDNRAVWIHWTGRREDSEYLQKVIPYEMYSQSQR